MPACASPSAALTPSPRSCNPLAASTTFAFGKVATALPQLAVVGGASQEFSVSAGIRVQTAIDLGTVCPGKSAQAEGLVRQQ